MSDPKTESNIRPELGDPANYHNTDPSNLREAPPDPAPAPAPAPVVEEE